LATEEQKNRNLETKLANEEQMNRTLSAQAVVDTQNINELKKSLIKL